MVLNVMLRVAQGEGFQHPPPPPEPTSQVCHFSLNSCFYYNSPWWLQHRYVGPSQVWTSWSQMWLHICYLVPTAGEHIRPFLASWTCPDLPDGPAPSLPPSWALSLADLLSEEANRGPHFVSSYVISPLHVRQTDSLPVFKNLLKTFCFFGSGFGCNVFGR